MESQPDAFNRSIDTFARAYILQLGILSVANVIIISTLFWAFLRCR